MTGSELRDLHRLRVKRDKYQAQADAVHDEICAAIRAMPAGSNKTMIAEISGLSRPTVYKLMKT